MQGIVIVAADSMLTRFREMSMVVSGRASICKAVSYSDAGTGIGLNSFDHSYIKWSFHIPYGAIA